VSGRRSDRVSGVRISKRRAGPGGPAAVSHGGRRGEKSKATRSAGERGLAGTGGGVTEMMALDDGPAAPGTATGARAVLAFVLEEESTER